MHIATIIPGGCAPPACQPYVFWWPLLGVSSGGGNISGTMSKGVGIHPLSLDILTPLPFRLRYPSYLKVMEADLSEMILCNYGLSIVNIYIGIDILLGGLMVIAFDSFRLSYPSYLNVIEVGLSEMILCNHGLSVVIIYVGIDILLGGLKGVWY